ncbi:MAG: hypothetical protein LBC60_01795 [Spirochaetaceae bacterium]|jgi:hypothetical protein|nr:hypothetical protein [Spirochaetaceae bacterium]
METTQENGGRETFETVWAALEATRVLVEENLQSIREMRESQKENERQMRESRQATERQMKATDKRIGELGNRFGEMVEYMIIPNLLTQFEELGFTFTKANRTEIKDKAHDIFAEIDVLLENGDKVMAVEIKSKPDIDDIKGHLERMEKLRRYADLHEDKRAYLGAMAGVVFGESEKTYALKNGFYVIEPSGDTFAITKPEGKYRPREW